MNTSNNHVNLFLIKKVQLWSSSNDTIWNKRELSVTSSSSTWENLEKVCFTFSLWTFFWFSCSRFFLTFVWYQLQANQRVAATARINDKVSMKMVPWSTGSTPAMIPWKVFTNYLDVSVGGAIGICIIVPIIDRLGVKCKLITGSPTRPRDKTRDKSRDKTLAFTVSFNSTRCNKPG